MQNICPQSIEHRRSLAKAMREAGAPFELIAEVLRNSAGNELSADNHRESHFVSCDPSNAQPLSSPK
ncbi:MAG: hypothetical protein K0S28_2146 [Paucimonas sp.]|jgi:hypothetical protein|nr:hypothetical protein [Paucimonas sp.]